MEPHLKNISVIVADSDPLFRDSISNLISHFEFVKKVSVADDSDKTIRLLESEAYDFIFIESTMKFNAGIDATRKIKELFPGICIIALTSPGEKHSIINMLSNVISAYLVKNADHYDFFRALQSINDFNNNTPKNTVDDLFADLRINYKDSNSFLKHRTHIDLLRQITFLISHGKSSKKISEILDLSKPTIDKYRGEILELTGSRNAVALIRFAVKKGIDEDELLKAKFSKFIHDRKFLNLF